MKERIRKILLAWVDDYSEDNCVEALHTLFKNELKAKWISVKKRLPKEDQEVFVIRKIGKKYYIPEQVTFKNGNFIGSNNDSDYIASTGFVTHWMNLPSNPTS